MVRIFYCDLCKKKRPSCQDELILHTFNVIYENLELCKLCVNKIKSGKIKIRIAVSGDIESEPKEVWN